MSKTIGRSMIFLLLAFALSACGDDVPNETTNEAPIGTTDEIVGEPTGENTTEQMTDFDLDINLASNEKIDVEFDVERNETEASYKVGDQSLKGAEALAEIEKMFTELNLTTEMKEEEVIEQVLTYFQVNREDVTDFELQIDFDQQDFIDIDDKSFKPA